MKERALILSLLLTAALLQAPPALSGSPTEDAEPSGEHKLLEATVGEWTYTMSIWPFTGLPPEQTTGEAKGEWVLGGRFVRQVLHGENGGEKFEGIGYTGYDREVEKYTSTWMDTKKTTILTGSGVCDADAKSITLEGEFEQAGLERPFKMVLKLDSKDAFTVEMWKLGAYEQLFKTYEIVYTRKK